MAGLVLRTFGGLILDRNGQPVEAMASQRRALALLAAIGAAGTRGITRDQAMLLFWPESNTERARGSLKQLLHEIRRLLDEPEIVNGVAELRLNRTVIECDVMQFRLALEAGDDALAVRLYGGAFLEGVHLSEADEFERWAEDERSELARLNAAALERLAVRADAAGEVSEALALWQRLQSLDPLNARLVMGLMRAHGAAGDRAGALRAAAAYHAAFEAELGAPPDAAVQALADELRTPHTSARRSLGSSSASPGPETDPHAGAPAGTSPRSRRVARVLFASALVGAALLLIAVLWPGVLPGSTEDALRPTRVAVAIFVNRTGSGELDNLGTMASDWVTRGLARNPQLDVFDVAGLYISGREPGGEPADPRALARRMGAGLVVAGNYYRSADGLTFSAQVIDVKSGRVLRVVDPISGTVENPLAVVEEIRQRTATALGTILDPRGNALATSAMVPPRYDAFEAYVKGQELYWRGDWAASLPYFRLAARLDTTFYSAIALIGVVGVGTAQCHLADSVLAVLEAKSNVPEVELLTARISVARCAADHAEHNRLHRLRIALVPNSMLMRLTMSTGFRQLNQPAEALEILKDIDPASDLGILRDGGRSFYWREIAANQHALGEYRAERATSDRMIRFEAAALAIEFFRARSFAGLGMADSAIAVLDRIADVPADPALLSGITGALDPTELAVPGWVMFQTALELDAHGHPAAAKRAVERSIAWYTRSTTINEQSPTRRIVLARALAFAGEHDRARTLLEQLAAEDPNSIDVRGLLGEVAILAGDTAAADSADSWLAKQTRVFPPGLPLYYRAAIAALRGERDRALRHLESLPSRAHPHDFLQFHVDPALVSLRNEPAFRNLLVPKG